jgi:hypothetical protein
MTSVGARKAGRQSLLGYGAAGPMESSKEGYPTGNEAQALALRCGRASADRASLRCTGRAQRGLDLSHKHFGKWPV